MPVNDKCVPYIDYGQSYHLPIKLVPVEMVNISEIMKGEIRNK